MTALIQQSQTDKLSAIRTIDSEIETLESLKESLDSVSLTAALDFMQNKMAVPCPIPLKPCLALRQRICRHCGKTHYLPLPGNQIPYFL